MDEKCKKNTFLDFSTRKYRKISRRVKNDKTKWSDFDKKGQKARKIKKINNFCIFKGK
jgi:hypothetical protein